ncbi:MAG: 3-phosphoshikimate 1-carboxyvinyltransferase [Candidatus Epulonipiscioides saccharophilum]|nr:MAG: 3-phosphoshikimate 1-carboxyvinyltransferase [Epulopiscium sp. AS2M-Bin001]
MSSIKIYPTQLNGEVVIPPSKSLAHRAIICASLSQGESIISNIDFSDDIVATIQAAKALGADIRQEKDTLYIKGIFRENFQRYRKGKKSDITIDCNESGSTLRFFVPISMIIGDDVRFTGRGNLGKRPLTPFYDIFNKQGIEYEYKVKELDLRIRDKLKADEFRLPGDISSQFISGLLFSLPLLEEDSTIVLTSPLESRGYIDLTLQTLEMFGIEITNDNYETFRIAGNQKYKATNYTVEGDFSQAAFFLIAGAIGNNIAVKNIDVASYQADKEVISLLERIGAKLTITDRTIVAKKDKLRAIKMNGSECPDIVPIMALILALCKGESEIANVARLRIKECDRLKAINSELSKLGAHIDESATKLAINGVEELYATKVLSSHKDHRIAMTIAIAATVSKNEIILEDPECVAKSYPSFWDDYKLLGGRIELVDSES